MRIIPGRTAITLERNVAIADGPILPQPYSTAGRRFRVERVIITYRWNGEGWENNGAYSTIVVGTVLKKDGSDSLNAWSGPIWDNRPAWLDEIANRLRPHDAPVTSTEPIDIDAEA